MAAIDWRAWTFPLLMLAAVLYLFRLDRDPANSFKLVQFVANQDGTANSASLGYVAALLVGTWLAWYEAINGRMSEWMLTGYLGAFVLGGAVRALIGSRERIALTPAGESTAP